MRPLPVMMPVMYLWSSALCMFGDKGLSAFDSENNVYVKLGVGICHDAYPWGTVHMSPLWGFGCLVYAACYKHAAPLGLNTAQFAARHPS